MVKQSQLLPLLVDWRRDSLFLGAETLTRHPSHLFHHLESNVLNGQLEILEKRKATFVGCLIECYFIKPITGATR